jgi:FkbM family methyltransferase
MLLQKIDKLILILHTPLYRNALLKHRTAASVEHDTLLHSLRKNIKCVIDIGANRGQFALVARKNFSIAKIYCFEPLSEPVKALKNVFKNDRLVIINQMAIGEADAFYTMHVSKRDDSSSLFPITSMQTNIFPGTEEKEIRLVQVKPLEAVIPKQKIEQPALLKVDVQGFESKVLIGCKSLLPLFSYVYIECSFVPLYAGQAMAYEVIDYLNDFGLIFSGIYNLFYDKNGIAVQGDFLFTNKEKSQNRFS